MSHLRKTLSLAKAVAKQVITGEFAREARAFVKEISGSPPHHWDQPCPHCGAQAAYTGETFVEGGGKRSWTDGIEATYTCPHGHTFSKRWTIPNLGD